MSMVYLIAEQKHPPVNEIGLSGRNAILVDASRLSLPRMLESSSYGELLGYSISIALYWRSWYP